MAKSMKEQNTENFIQYMKIQKSHFDNFTGN